ncbi:proline-rich receptor-like protein kinase PERK10-like protein [Trifolium pratense]|uniref:Proline-rich receptor-like protein kinase PERK10-like protein n=1 Tax=Trifolium pratense TaxID=57577 RepID=A0A2K3L9M0_TRIPR|nr:proline-rich receptor-like protein kinase PERK10-like protein [Trifolium pratense]
MASTQSNNPPIVIVVVVVCSGGLVLLSLITFVLFCFFQKRKEKKTQETDVIHIDEHKKGNETIVSGPFGQQSVAISVEDDVHVDEEKKKETLDHGLHAESSSDIIRIDEHKKDKESMVPGPFGRQAVEISVEDDVHVDEARKSEKHGHGLHVKSSSAEANHNNSSSLEVGSSDDHHHQLENKS